MRTDENYNESVEYEEIEQFVEQESVNDVLTGVVSGCKKLYVREAPNKAAAPVKIIEVYDEVMIEVDGSTEDFYKVYTASGVEGFCMKDFITVRP